MAATAHAADEHIAQDRRPRRILLAGALAVLIAAALLAVTALRPSSAGGTPGEGSADVGFARDMAVHHQQAVEMSFIIRDRTKDEDIRRLAYDIINTQANQRGMMLGWLEAWGVPKSSGRPPMEWMDGHHGHRAGSEAGGAPMPGMATRAELERLRTARGRAAEVLYLRLMTDHHRGGVEMARAAARQAAGEEIRGLAGGMATAQQSELRLMADMLRERGAKPS
ncbi:hypothetical protein ACZ90_19110 [Streptomyces albus subsp. albus]|nr:hypothetical protein ACZ90_19110 [Streptomyces albus subsp. albus]